MKILIVNTWDIVGGAARAAYRLYKALLAEGINSTMLVQDKVSDDYSVIGPETKLQKAFAKVRLFLDQLPLKFYKNRTKTLFSPPWLPFSDILHKINAINPDIVHLHWICGGMLRIEDIARIKAPIVWSLHDMWAFTGGCHYDEECSRYEKECGSCPVLGSVKKNDLSNKIFKRKQKTFNLKKDITIVGLSKWINECSKRSLLLKDRNHINLPNPIDTSIFKPFDKSTARNLWNLPKNKKIVLFGAIGAKNDPRKGFKELREALRLIKTDNMELVVFGSSQPQKAPDFGFKTHYLGHLHDDISLTTLYNAADLMVVPSLRENLSNSIMESLSCGTPVVAFNIGGNSDMIDHLQNGYLAKPFEIEDLACGIEWVLNASNYKDLCINARKKVLENFDSKIVAKKYIELYKSLLNK